MSQEELDDLRRQIGTPKLIFTLPQIKEEIPTLREIVKNMEVDDIDDDEYEDEKADDDEEEEKECWQE